MHKLFSYLIFHWNFSEVWEQKGCHTAFIPEETNFSQSRNKTECTLEFRIELSSWEGASSYGSAIDDFSNSFLVRVSFDKAAVLKMEFQVAQN